MKVKEIRVNKKVISNLIIYIVVFIMYGLSYCNLDYEQYEMLYNIANATANYEYVNMDKFYMKFMALFGKIGVDYAGYIAIMTIGLLFLLSRIIRKYTDSHYIVLGLYAIAPLPLLICQFRSFIAFCIICYGFTYYLDEKKSDFGFYICLLLASMFHSAMLLFLLLAFTKYIDLRKVILLVAVVIVFVFAVLHNAEMILNIGAKMGLNNQFKIKYYLVNVSQKPNINGFMSVFLLYLVWLAFLLFLMYELYFCDENRNGDLGTISMSSFLRYCCRSRSEVSVFLKAYLALAVLIPLLTVNTIFERYFFYLHFFMYLLAAYTYRKIKTSTGKKNIMICLTVGVLYDLFYMYYVENLFVRLIVPMMRSNYFVDWIKSFYTVGNL